MKYLTTLLIAVLFVSCSKEKSQTRPDEQNVASQDAAADEVLAVTLPDVLEGQFLRDTVQLKRFNPAGWSAFEQAVPIAAKSPEARELAGLVYVLTANQAAVRAPKEALESLDRSRDIWWMVALDPDENLAAWAESGAPFLGSSYSGIPFVRALLPASAPAKLEQEIARLCETNRERECRGLVAMESVAPNYLRVDVRLPLSGLVTPEDQQFPASVGVEAVGPPTTALRAFFAEGIAYAHYQRSDAARRLDLISRLGVALGARAAGRTLRAPTTIPAWQIPFDEYGDFVIRAYVNAEGAHADLHHTYRERGKERVENLNVDVRVPAIDIEDPVVEFEWAANFDSATRAIEVEMSAQKDPFESPAAWAISPTVLAGRSPLGAMPLGFQLPFFTRSGILGVRIRIGAMEGEKKPRGAVLVLTEDFSDDVETKRQFRTRANTLWQAFGWPTDEEVRKQGDHLLHIFRYGEDVTLGEMTEVSTDARGEIDLQRAVQAGSRRVRVQPPQDSESRTTLRLRRTSHQSGATLQVTYGESIPTLEWSEVPLFESMPRCEREAINQSHEAYVSYRPLRNDPTLGLAHIQEHIMWLRAHECASSSSLITAWQKFEKAHEAQEVASLRYGIRAFCSAEKVCEIPDDLEKTRHALWMARCISKAYPGSEILEYMSFAEKMTPAQARAFFEEKMRTEGIKACPTLDVFWPRD